MNKPIKLSILLVMLFFVAGVSLAMAWEYSYHHKPCYYCPPPEPPPPPPSYDCDGVRSPGYWSNHEFDEACFYNFDYICFDYVPQGGGDKCDTMLRQIIAANLNIENGCKWDCIEDTLYYAEEWFVEYCVSGPGVHAGGKDSPWREGEPLYKKLDAYNNGRLCAPKAD